MNIRDEALRELDRLIETGKRAASSYALGEMATFYSSDVPEHQLRAFRASGAATVERLTGRGSEFYKHLPSKEAHLQSSRGVVEGVLGVCGYRSMPITDSGASRSLIPVEADHRFRSKPIAERIAR